MARDASPMTIPVEAVPAGGPRHQSTEITQEWNRAAGLMQSDAEAASTLALSVSRG